MARRTGSFRPIIAIYTAILAVIIAQASLIVALGVGGQQQQQQQYYDENDRELETSPRRLELGVVSSDQYAEAVLTVENPIATRPLGFGYHDHARITSILSTTKEMIDTARVLVQNERTLQEGKDMMERANAMFREVKEHIIQKNRQHKQREAATYSVGGVTVQDTNEEHREMLRKKYFEHDLERAQEEDARALDVARKIYETMVTFPECVEKLFEDCLAIINAEIAELGLATIEIVVHEKRNVSQEGYNKVVIITNELADRVVGRTGDGLVNYPFLWYDTEFGQRTLGVDGKWNCHDFTPDQCCNSIKQSVPNPDTRGNYIECHIFVPFGGVGNPRRNDRVFIVLSPDGRVHEPPIIQ